MTEARLVLTTASSRQEADKIARALLERRLAACVNIVPGIESIYRWQCQVESSTECLLLVKTQAIIFPLVEKTIRELHSYQLPECIMLAVEDGSASYLEWISTSTRRE